MNHYAIDLARLRNAIAVAPVEPGGLADNLAIALCTYFSDHPDRPDDDEHSERGWGIWVEDKANAALDAIVDTVVSEIHGDIRSERGSDQ